jgi:hypothetical protein
VQRLRRRDLGKSSNYLEGSVRSLERRELRYEKLRKSQLALSKASKGDTKAEVKRPRAVSLMRRLVGQPSRS